VSSEDKYESIVRLAKKRGFFWPSYEIYGGMAGFYDLGPLGVILKNNIVNLWREYFVIKHLDMVVEIETPIITPKIVFEASGHLQHFTDPIVECLRCGRKYRADQLIEDTLKMKVEGLGVNELTRIVRENNLTCPACGGPLSDVKEFNLLFQTYVGPYTQNIAYLRPEAAQGMFVNFKNVYTVMREKLPLGIAQIGKVARNEISPRQGMFRLREFTIMEVEFFYDPEDPSEPPFDRFNGKLRILTAEARAKGLEEVVEVRADEAYEEGLVKSPWLAYWMGVANEFVKALGVLSNEILFEEKLPHERAHYATQTFDQLVKVSRWGWIEVSGHAYRSDYDLSRHIKYSGQDLRVFKRYDKPVIKYKERLVINKAILGRMYKSELPKILKAIEDLGIDKIKELLSSSGSDLVIAGYSIPKDALKIVREEVKVMGEHVVPHVAEPSFGAERLVLVVLDKAYDVEKDGRVVLRLPPRIAPIKVAVFPLVSREPLTKIAMEIYMKFLKHGITAIYDDSGSIGRRYARADEIGVPFAVTVDYDTPSDGTVTIRFRDTREQIRVKVSDVINEIKSRIEYSSSSS